MPTIQNIINAEAFIHSPTNLKEGLQIFMTMSTLASLMWDHVLANSLLAIFIQEFSEVTKYFLFLYFFASLVFTGPTISSPSSSLSSGITTTFLS